MKIKFLLTLALLTLVPSLLRAQEATIARLAGAESVTVTLPSGEEAMMGQGDVIPVGSWVEVPSGKLFLRTFTGTVSVFSSGSVFEVTEIEATEGKEKTRLTLQSGDMVANLDPNKRDVNDYGVVTPKGVAAARGTNYTVSVNGVDVAVTVSGGQVQLSIPNIGSFNLSAGQGSTGGAPAALANLISAGGQTADLVKTALQATASAVSTLVASGEPGVSADALSGVIATTGAAAAAASDTTLLAQTAAAASAAATEVKVEAAAELAAATTPAAQEAAEAKIAAANSATTNVVQTAVASDSSVATAVVAAVTNAVVTTDTSADTSQVATDLTNSANQTLQTTDPQAPAVDAGAVETNVESETVEVSEAAPTDVVIVEETVTDPNVPTDNVSVDVSTTFSFELSNGQFVVINLTESGVEPNVTETTTVTLSDTSVTPTSGEIGNGELQNFTIPQVILTVMGPLSPTQRSAIVQGINQVISDLNVVEVPTTPGNVITVSPSS